MEIIKEKKYELNVLWINLSKFFERSGYYGLRSLLFLYMFKHLKIDQQDTALIYGFFTGLVGVSYIIGGVIGDLLTGNKLATIIGSGTMAIGAFCLCIPDVSLLYIGLLLIIIGSGLYGPNTFSLLSRSHQNNPKTLDGSFTIMNLSINLGAFIGVLAISYFALENYTLGFALSGIFLVISCALSLLVKKQDVPAQSHLTHTVSWRAIMIIGSILISGIFWGIYELSGVRTNEIITELSQLADLPVPGSFINSIPPVMAIFCALPLFLLWTFIYIKPIIKIGIGLLIAAGSFLLIVNFPQKLGLEHLNSFMLILFLLALVEVLISPSVFSIIALNSSPKFQGMIFAASTLPSRIFSMVILPVLFEINIDQTPLLVAGILLLVLLGVGSLILGFLTKEKFSMNEVVIHDALD